MSTVNTPLSTVPALSASPINTLLNQLKVTNVAISQASRPALKKDQIEEFIVEKAGTLIAESVDMMQQLKDYVSSAPNAQDVEALAGLINATSAAIETLNKIIVIDKRVAGAIKVKEMDGVQKRQQLVDETQAGILLSREQVLKEIITRSTTVVDISAKTD